MAKKAAAVVVTNQKQFFIVAGEFKVANSKKKEFEKACEKLKPALKAYIDSNPEETNENGSKFLRSPDVTVELRCVPKNKSQEEMVTYLKSIGRKDCLKTIEVVDEEALETSVMNGEIKAKQLENLQNKTFSLYVS